jgi:cobalt-zinc-cadmium efflux system outer membrane protein
VTLDVAIQTAFTQNPDLLVARFRVDSARAEGRIAHALPNPTVSATPGNPSQYALQVPLDIGPSRRFRGQVATAGLEATTFDALDSQRQLLFAVRQAFYDVLLADSLSALAHDQAVTFRQLLVADSIRLRNGSIAEREIVSTHLQLAHAEALAARAVVQQHATRLTLQELMGVEAPDTALLVTGRLQYRRVDLNPDSVLHAALGRRPDLTASQFRVAQAASAVSLANSNLLPVPVAGVAYQPAQPFASGSHVAPAIGVTLPILYVFSGERARARAARRATEVSLAHVRTQIHDDVALAFDTFLTARALADRYACGLLEEATGTLEAARYAYDRGATALPDLLETIRSYGDTRADFLTAVHDYWVSLFALERAAGAHLPSAEP